jgi:hypothetical protein
VVLAVLRDLSEPPAVAGLVGGLVAWRLRRPWVAGGALTVAVLAREVMVLGVIAIAIEAVWRRVARRDPVVVGDALRACVPPACFFVARAVRSSARGPALGWWRSPGGRNDRPGTAAMVCFAVVSVLVDYCGDHWNCTRVAAPLMASLVVFGVDERDRAALAVPALAACLTLLIPIAFSAGAGA